MNEKELKEFCKKIEHELKEYYKGLDDETQGEYSNPCVFISYLERLIKEIKVLKWVKYLLKENLKK